MADQSKGKQKTIVEEFIVTLAVLIAGVALQVFLGGFNKTIVAFPVNLILIFITGMLFLLKKSKLLKRLASGSLSVVLLAEITVIAILMGLIPGNEIKESWPFVLLWMMITVNLTAVITHRFKNKGFRDYSFLLNHLGVLILMFAGGPGSADKARYFMRVAEGETEWRGEPSGKKPAGEIVELPIAITLDDFIMEEYPPKIAIIDRATGEMIPKGGPASIESILNEKGRIERWTLSIDSTIDRPRYAPAAYVSVNDTQKEESFEGWVTCGNSFQLYKTLDLPDELCVAMTYPEPKSFNSHVVIYTKSGIEKRGVVSVNHPITAGSWRIYQHSYDKLMGKESEWSIFELVYDPWLIPALIGIFLIMTGAVTLIFKGGKS